MWADETADPQLRYQLRCIDDLHSWLMEQGDWVDLGAADEQKPAKEGTVEAWGRSENNPVGGWYGLRKGYRGRCGLFVVDPASYRGLLVSEPTSVFQEVAAVLRPTRANSSYGARMVDIAPPSCCGYQRNRLLSPSRRPDRRHLSANCGRMRRIFAYGRGITLSP
jgi:hypothetical protein